MYSRTLFAALTLLCLATGVSVSIAQQPAPPSAGSVKSVQIAIGDPAPSLGAILWTTTRPRTYEPGVVYVLVACQSPRPHFLPLPESSEDICAAIQASHSSKSCRVILLNQGVPLDDAPPQKPSSWLVGYDTDGGLHRQLFSASQVAIIDGKTRVAWLGTTAVAEVALDRVLAGSLDAVAFDKDVRAAFDRVRDAASRAKADGFESLNAAVRAAGQQFPELIPVFEAKRLNAAKREQNLAVGVQAAEAILRAARLSHYEILNQAAADIEWLEVARASDRTRFDLAYLCFLRAAELSGFSRERPLLNAARNAAKLENWDEAVRLQSLGLLSASEDSLASGQRLLQAYRAHRTTPESPISIPSGGKP